MDARADMNVASTSSSSNSRLTGTSSSSNSTLTVCRNWLEGTCPENNHTCTTGIHQYNLSRMPMCPSFEREEMCPTGAHHCIYRHQCPIECIMYKIGFCPAGPRCFFIHVKRDGSTPSVDQVVKFHRQAQSRPLAPLPLNTPPPQQNAPSAQQYPPSAQQYAQQYPPPPQQYAPSAQQYAPSLQQYPPAPSLQQYPPAPSPFGPPRPLSNAPLPGIAAPPVQSSFNSGNPQVPQLGPAMPSTVGSKQITQLIGICRYFVMKIESLDTLRYAAKSGLWRIHRNIKDNLNNAFSKCDHVVLIFFSNETGQLQGCAKMMSEIGQPVPGLWNDKTWEAKYIGEFCQIRWIKLCEISFNKITSRAYTVSGNEFVQDSTDGQELEPFAGNMIFKIIMAEANKALMAVARSHGTNIYIQKDSTIVLHNNAPHNLRLDQL